MPMGHPKTPGLAVLSQWTDKIALELVFAEPGKDNGLLPINSLLSEAEAWAAGNPLPPPLGDALRQAREWVDAVFATGTFDAAQLTRFRDWTTWIQNALSADLAGRTLPPLPAFTASAAPPPAAAPAAAPPAQEEDIVLNIEGDGELLREFANESHEHLQNIELGVLTLEENPTDYDTLNSIFRAFHTFKGGSGFLNLRPINHLAHQLESLLDLARQQKLAIDSSIINIILTGGDTLKQFITAIESQLNGQNAGIPILVPTQILLGRIRAVLDGNSRTSAEAAPPPPPVQLPAVAPIEPAPAAPPPPDPVPVPTAAKPAAPGVPNAPGNKATGGATAVKVDTQKLDTLIDLVGEMVIAQTMVAQDPDLLAVHSQQLSRNMGQLGRITKELQRIATSLRMVPIRSTFQKMTRLVRDLSVKAGKQVELRMSGEDTELDRTIVEEINDPLVHMIRNAMDHGIEKAETRLQQGKSPHGTVSLRAFHQGGNIVIEVKDDGAGLNRDRIRQKAIERGLLGPEAQLEEKDIFALIFAPGFSTADKITDISGRGVGMDVVRRNIDKLRGKIEIQSIPGKGSVFTIFLPLTLAIIDGMLVSVGHQRYIIPTLAVRESFRPTTAMISTLYERGEMVNVRGRLLPLLRLHEQFGVEPRSREVTEGIVVVVESDRECRCLLVDRLVGKQEVVIKSLGETFKENPALAGAAILGDGRVGLILDVNTLVKLTTAPLRQAA
jgi:two-component system, chemotaxis family, sensor kinase CheA